jgi:hypothetical protein
LLRKVFQNRFEGAVITERFWNESTGRLTALVKAAPYGFAAEYVEGWYGVELRPDGDPVKVKDPSGYGWKYLTRWWDCPERAGAYDWTGGDR